MLSRKSCIHPSTQLESNLPKGIETVFEGQLRDELYGFFNLVVWCTQGAKIENVKDFLLSCLIKKFLLSSLLMVVIRLILEVALCKMHNKQYLDNYAKHLIAL